MPFNPRVPVIYRRDPDLLDSQNNSLNADRAAADAVNDYLLDLIRV